jgi:hypothetical protein
LSAGDGLPACRLSEKTLILLPVLQPYRTEITWFPEMATQNENSNISHYYDTIEIKKPILLFLKKGFNLLATMERFSIFFVQFYF